MKSRTLAAHPPALPLAVQVGFTGTRRVVAEGAADPAAFERAVVELLTDELRKLPGELGLSAQHFVVGVSQMAAGADLAFSECASDLGWGQRVFLPQLRDDFLAAVGSEGPDFKPPERQRAIELLARPHIVEERVVSTAASRADRFDEANLQILSEVEVLVCLRRADDRPGRIGGSVQFAERARARGVPVLELQLHTGADGLPAFERRWLSGPSPGFEPPALPAAVQREQPTLVLQGADWPEPQDYADGLKKYASALAGQRQSGFHRAAGIIVGTHVLATLIAATLLAHLLGGIGAKLALAVELALLAWGFLTHHRLHALRHTEDWAMARLCAEVARSAREVARLPGSLAFLRGLAMPTELRPVLRTLELLHLRSLRRRPSPDWKAELERYVKERLEDPDPRKGQVAYYAKEQAKAHRLATWSGRIFAGASALAFIATATKLVLKCTGVDVGHGVEWLGVAAVALPVFAVAAMSIAAARDAEARDHTFAQMRDFLAAQIIRLRHAASVREAAALASETELRLLGETVTWHTRRAFTSIA